MKARLLLRTRQDDKRTAMNPLNEHYAIVYQNDSGKACQVRRMALLSAGIAAQVSRHEDAWCVIVESKHRSAAIDEVAAYEQENEDATPAVPVRTVVRGGAAVGIVAYCVLLTAIHLALRPPQVGEVWLENGQMRVSDFWSGEVWRAVTALTLHADAEHLLSNLLFGCVFGYLTGRIFGGGFAWFAIIVAGTIGNALNAMIQPPGHTSIGASTAVFASLGILVSHATIATVSSRSGSWQRWTPIIGGILLFSFLGVGGPRTDVLAHVTGMIAGGVIGWLMCRIPARWLADDVLQWIAGTIAIWIIVLAWIIAI